MVKVKGQILNFLVNASPPKPFDVVTSNFVAEKVTMGNIMCDLNLKVKGQILNFLVNASPPKAFDIVTSNSVGA